MGKNERFNSLPALWYLEQTLKLRGIKFTNEEEKVFKNIKLEGLVLFLRYSFVIYIVFDILILILEAIGIFKIAATLVRFFVVLILLILSLAFTFFHSSNGKTAFFALTYGFLLAQSVYTGYYLYSQTNDETPPISPFVPLDTFFIFLFVRFNFKVSVALCVLRVLINEILVITLYPNKNFKFEVGNFVLYAFCAILAFISGYVMEANMRSKYFLTREIEKDRSEMENERVKAEKLLYNILPRSIADSLKNDLSLLTEDRETDVIADNFDDITIAFCDICDFTVMSSEMSPEKIVGFLNEIFSSFDNIIHEFGLEKIKTIGDAYMFAGGLSKTFTIRTKHGQYTPAEAVAEMSLLMQDQIELVSKKVGHNIRVRIGINSGPVVAGIVGISKFIYDLFGETVNQAAKMESSGQPGRIHVSEATYLKLESKYDFEEAQEVDMKGKMIKTWFLSGRKSHLQVPSLSVDTFSSSDFSTDILQQVLMSTQQALSLGTAYSSPRKAIPTPEAQTLGPKVVTNPTKDAEKLQYQIQLSQRQQRDLQNKKAIEELQSSQEDSIGSIDSPYTPTPTEAVPMFERSISPAASFIQNDKSRKPNSAMTVNVHQDATNIVIRPAGYKASSKLERSVSKSVIPQFTSNRWQVTFNGVLEQEYKKDYFRRYRRLIQINALGSLSLFLILCVLIIVILPEIDYILLLIFGVVFAVLSIFVGSLYYGSSTAHFPYAMALQSLLASAGVVALASKVTQNGPDFRQLQQLWDSAIIMLTFSYVFPGLQFAHSLLASVTVSIGLIVLVAVQDAGSAFAIIVRIGWANLLGVAMSFQKERESREAYFVTQTMDGERRKLVAERTKSERLLYCIMPQKIAARLTNNEGSVAETFFDVSVMFVSIHNFTGLTISMAPFEKIALLNKIFSKFDKLCETHKLEKIKTIGDTYLVVGGLPVPRANHLASIAEMALDMQEAISQFRAPNGERYKIKAGISAGKVVAGVIGIYKFSYDLWGDTVNTSSRMESHSLPGHIQVTENCQKRLSSKFELTDRGSIQVKGKGQMHTYFLVRPIRPRMRALSLERLPNQIPSNSD